MRKKIIVSLIVLAIVIAGFAFLKLTKSKTLVACGSALPQVCQKCTCSSGYAKNAAPIGSYKIVCSDNSEPICDESYVIENFSK